MSYLIEISIDAAKDIDSAFEYYNNASPGLGFRFINMIDDYFEAITLLPTPNPTPSLRNIKNGKATNSTRFSSLGGTIS